MMDPDEESDSMTLTIVRIGHPKPAVPGSDSNDRFRKLLELAAKKRGCAQRCFSGAICIEKPEICGPVAG
jgi:hypothetical protein